MAYKEKKLSKADIEAMYNALSSDPSGSDKRTGKGKKPSTVKRSGNKISKKR